MATQLEELAALMQEAEDKRSKLAQLASTQVQQPTHASLGPKKSGLARLGQLMGVGATPEQRQYMLRMLGEQQNPGETRMDAWSRGMLKADDVAMQRAKGRHQTQLQAAQMGAQNAQTHLGNSTDLYKLQQEAEAVKRAEQAARVKAAEDAKKRGTVSYGGGVWETDQYGRSTGQLLGATEGELSRVQDQYYKAVEAEEAARQASLEKLSKAEQSSKNASDIMENISDVRARAENTTPGAVSALGGWIYGTDAWAYRKSIDSLRAKLGTAKLQELRAAAASGASGMGNLTEKELDRLETSIAAIDTGMDKHDLERNLQIIERYYLPALEAYERLQQQAGVRTPSTPAASGGAIINWEDL